MYSMITIANTDVYMKVIKRLDPKSSHYKVF